MKVILVGYPGSQNIVPASKYLVSKYLSGFDIHWLNYAGDKEGWSMFIGSYLAHFQDEHVILALDDYLLSEPLDVDIFQQGLMQFRRDPQIVCVKLCETTLKEHFEYPVTTQYCIWNRDFLIWLLTQTKDPWHFEMTGSAILKETDKHSVCSTLPALKYDVHSALSSRWQGINWNGVKQEDLDYIKNNNLIK